MSTSGSLQPAPVTFEEPDGPVRLAIQLSGDPDAPPLLLLPGQANSHRWWDFGRGAFDEHFRVITFDYRGTGDSEAVDWPDEDWSTSRFAADAVAVLDRLGIDQTYLYGTSMGGRVGQMLAIEHPGRLLRMVLACTSPGGRHARERSREVRARLADPDVSARRAALWDLMYTPDRPHDAGSTLLGTRMSRNATRQHLRVSARHDAYDRLPDITVPTLVSHGADDLMSPAENARTIADRIPGADLFIHHRGRHGFFDEFADQVTPLAIEHLLG